MKLFFKSNSPVGDFSNRIISFSIFLFAGLYLTATIFGGIKNFTPTIAGADMWYGYLDFYLNADHLSVWIDYHNHHRIILSRILFWLDIKFFHGGLYFLIIVNYLLAVLGFIVIYALLKERIKDYNNNNLTLFLGLVVFCFVFSFSQWENFTWAFQSQFFFAQLIPLAAFFLLYKAKTATSHSRIFFTLSCLLGFAAYGTMLNAITTLPLMCLLAWMLGMRLRITIFLFFLSLLALFLYFSTPIDFGPEVRALSSANEHLIVIFFKIVNYIIVTLGAPFAAASDLLFKNKALIFCAGIFFALSTLYFFIKACWYRKSSALEWTLLTFILFVALSAGMRAIGRPDIALSSRYLTPTLMAWAVLLILYAPFILKQMQIHRYRLLPLMLIIILLIPPQKLVLQNNEETLFAQKIETLALALGTTDFELHKSSHANFISSVAAKAVEENLSIFGNSVFKDVSLLMQQKNETISSVLCTGYMAYPVDIEHESQYKRVNGYLANAQNSKAPSRIQILTPEKVIVGYALVNPANSNVNFKGYILAQANLNGLILKGIDPECELQITTPKLENFFVIKDMTHAPTAHFANTQQILMPNEWLGSDFYKTQMDGFKVLGSYIRSDADVGSIQLQLNRGDSLYFRSGPIITNQFFIIENEGEIFKQTPPVAENWVILEFSSPNLPETFKITLNDEGVNWGEWSAIALKEAENTP